MKFDYKDIGEGALRPHIRIKIRNPKNAEEVSCYALVDSGADMSLFDPILAAAIGIDFEQGVQRPVQGVVAGAPGYFFEHTVEVIIGGHIIPMSVGFMPGMASNGNGLLGQSGFFEAFNFVKFDKRRHVVELGSFKIE